ncbi:hypothetical protein PsYK624_037670 [Phanerochaete sordida]|uniref:Transmembrane protein n=1 Tax=Phanerochaete sordida TaxID=48140 RepID=A0A9P3LAN2_9APHY|nr:hypothetical protein PsYK624_037670 [Phanerochaete sordida]
MYSWNTTIDDTSPIVLFSPYSEGPVQNGWAGWFSDSGFVTTGGEQAVGSSIHYTSFPGASLYLQFEGTAIYLYGTTNCTYTVTLDSQSAHVPLSLPFGLLFYQEGLTPTTHSVQLTAQPQASSTQMLGFDQAVFTNTIDQDTNGLATIVYENWNDTLQYTGNWTNQSGVDWIPNTQAPAPYVETSQGLSSVSLTFAGGVAVAVNGPRNWGHWTYNISLDDEVTSWNCSTLWGIGDTVLFYQNGLDPTKQHTVKMIDTGMQDYYKLSLNDFTVYAPNNSNGTTAPISSASGSPSSASPTAPSASSGSPTAVAAVDAGKKTNVGAIVGPVIAGMVVLILALLAVLWWRRRRVVQWDIEEPVAPFPKNDRAEIWVKGQEVGLPHQPVVRVYEPIVAPAVSGKRSVPAPPPSEPSAPSTVSESIPEGSRPSLGQPRPLPSHSQQPSISGSQSTAPQGSVQAVDVNQLVELIAQRIDPRTTAPQGEAPPRYPASPY